MPSTFMGLETARRALSAQQTALSTVSNNVANANTAGYTRQRVTLQSTSPYPAVSKNSDLTAGQIGTGVKAGSVERVRDSFLDYQYRTENTKYKIRLLYSPFQFIIANGRRHERA